MCSPRSFAGDRARARRGARARAQVGLEHAERVRPQLGHGGAEAGLVAQTRRPQLGVQAVVGLLAVDLRREAGELGVVGRSSGRSARDRPPRRDSGARSCAPTRADAARRAARSGSRRARGRRPARRRRCPAPARRARTARARGRSRSARSTRTRRPPRASARSRSTPSRASRGSARRQRSTEGAMPARSRAMRNLSLIE